jgi:hypothetical protein
MARHKMVNGVKVDFTAEEEAARDIKEAAFENARPVKRMVELRRQRDALLAETDWMGNQDYSITDAWKTYRQALRDVTSQTPSDDALSNINWPTKPS